MFVENMTAAQIEHVEDWIAALRGEKTRYTGASYKQGQGFLRKRNGFCCLGVGCDRYNPQLWEFGKFNGVYRFLDEEHDLPKLVQDYFGLRDPEGFMRYEPSDNPKPMPPRSLINANDTYEMDFNAIADLIEANLKRHLSNKGDK